MNITELIEEKCKDGVKFYRLDEIVDFLNGKGHEKNINENGKYIVVNSKFVSTDGEVKKFSNEQICPLYKDDVLMVMSDLPNGRALAKCFYVDEDNKYTLNQRICALKVKNVSLLSPRFLYYYLNRNKQLLKFDNGVDQTNLKKDDILNIRVAVPPLEVQCEIVNILDNFTLLSAELSAELKARQKQYEYYSNKLLDLKEYEYDSLENLCEIVDYRGKTPQKVSNGIFLVTAKNIRKGFIDYEKSQEYISEYNYDEIMHRGLPKIGDVLITTEAPCGNVAQVDNENIALAQRVIKYRPKDSKINSTFLKYILLSDEFQNKLLKNATGGTVKGIKGSKLHKLTIPVPPIDIQLKITKILDNFDKLNNNIILGIPAEIEARQKQYEYYRDKLLTFKELVNEG